MTVDWYYQEIKARYGVIKRCRGLYLYTAKGVRLVDMYQDAGRASLGRANGSGHAMLALKNVMARGLTSRFITSNENQVDKVVLKTFSNFSDVRYFSTKQTAANAVAIYCNKDFSLAELADCSFEAWLAKENIPIWRPFSFNQKIESNFMLIMPPFSWGELYILVSKKVKGLSSVVSDAIPSCVLSGLARSFYDYEAEKQQRLEDNYTLYDDVLSKYFDRKGAYLYTTVSQENYKDFVLHCMNYGLLISPFYDVPSIVPYSVNIGDIKKLKNNPFIADK